ncbi:uncharacterized protein LOC110973512 [Acanthaster planci]|uniref:Uncharacterized protein LOC110973512 n=1 Tax=Acanthaster planci TaxID=133434 RepID=A0A8B7XIQ0_ACAPL|nr:uncharacterized protein LOC110973512 [Acanthaster planci]
MAVSLDQDPDALLDIVLRMDTNANHSNNDDLLASSFQDTQTLHGDQMPVFTDLSNSVFDDIDTGPQLTDLNGLVDIDNLPHVPFTPDTASLPHNHQGSDATDLGWGQSSFSAAQHVIHPHSQATTIQAGTPATSLAELVQLPLNFPKLCVNGSTHQGTLPNIQFITMQHANSDRHPQPKNGPSGTANPPHKPKTRRRVTTASQRKAANVRERRRMFNLNEAFDILRKSVPTFAYEKRLSRIETLRLAMLYITFMGDLLNGKQSGDGNLQKLLDSGNFAGLTNSNPGPGQAACPGRTGTVLNSAASRMNTRTVLPSGGINGS